MPFKFLIEILDRLDRHSLEVSATVFKDILIGNTDGGRQAHVPAQDFEELDELVSAESLHSKALRSLALTN